MPSTLDLLADAGCPGPGLLAPCAVRDDVGRRLSRARPRLHREYRLRTKSAALSQLSGL
ncbi:hypothetical protein I545_6521 [Mycobacterium kansasii 662]|uniref:Uncharacterized protein n=1 Tax=Mycobacterium kansasii 662 TaxID=1299326 RepID=X7YHN9_MYCKA|nr:hypothetical protein I545_6521 [Mycobacterium kansasii 662]